ncbi:TDP-N-acetylfucosamine:lipid II N-acetylfucosaminyltransferase [Leifsonia sp. A12D58]|uniref:TDP-N-acetylfucosamine:lipid II N-acetylfucosaminyltransferase n=1 Tax=Leifsonia sp. A12D58 TaxID=3397674 RepID=UPI0039E1F09F
MARSHITEHFFDFLKTSGAGRGGYILLGPGKSADWPRDSGYTVVAPRNRITWILAHIYLATRAQRIFVHGLSKSILFSTALTPWVLSKCYWLIWGGDLYAYRHRRASRNNRAVEPVRRFVIKRIGHLVTYVPGDVARARQWYGARGQWHECLLYPGNTVQLPAESQEAPHSIIRVLVGNSADPENNHLETFAELSRIGGDFTVHVPLAYGDAANRERVMRVGQELFGDRFMPILGMMPFGEYLAFLQSIDIAIFNHKRQQAMGNTISLLGMGKRVFIRSQTPQWDLFKEFGVTVSALDNGIDLNLMSENLAEANKSTIATRFSLRVLSEQWKRLLDD